MRPLARFLVAGIGILVTTQVCAEAIYKSKNAEGETVYSDTPPATPNQPATEIAPERGPSAAEVREAEAQNKQTQQLNQQYERDRKVREAEQAAQDAANAQSNTTTVVPRAAPVPVPARDAVVPGDPYLRERREELPVERPIEAPRERGRRVR